MEQARDRGGYHLYSDVPTDYTVATSHTFIPMEFAMSQLKHAVRSFLVEDEGATMVEYGLMVALIAVIVMVAVGPLGTAISTMFVNVTNSI